MQLPRIPALIGALLGLISVGLGIAALVTKKWAASWNYSIFTLNSGHLPTPCNTNQMKQVIQGLEIGGVAAIAVGVIVSVLLNIIVKNRWIKRIPLILLILGPTAIFIGLILLLQCTGPYGLGYSIILMIVASILGYIVAICFAMASSGGGHHYHSSTTITTRETVRF